MLAGTIVMEDQTITYCQSQEQDGMICFTVTDNCLQMSESSTVPQDAFFKALAIAVHNDGTPDYREDYDTAESIMFLIRWIP